MKKVVIACAVAASVSVNAQQLAPPKVPPTVDQILSLKRAGSPAISPDGRFVAYTVRETNWDDNAYETEIWLADVSNATTRQLTNAKKSSRAPLVPGLAAIKQAAVDAGALGCSLSGSGPSLFALCRDASTAVRVAAAMTDAVRHHIGGAPQTYVSPIAPRGARVV